MIATKSQSLKHASQHAIERSIERYGSISKRRCEIICANIRGRKNVVRLCDTGGRTRFACFDRNEWYLVVYDWESGTIITFLPHDALFHHEKRILKDSSIYRGLGVDSFDVLNSRPMRFCLGKNDEAWGVRVEIFRLPK